jgi:hypothetical protein
MDCPDKTIAAAGDEEGNANVLSANRQIIMPALDLMVARIEETLLLLAKAIVMLVGGRGRGSQKW